MSDKRREDVGRHQEVIARVIDGARDLLEAARTVLGRTWDERKRAPQAEAAVTCWIISTDLCMGVTKLSQRGEWIPAWTLMRSQVEADLKGYWSLNADKGVLLSPDVSNTSYNAVGSVLHGGQRAGWVKKLPDDMRPDQR